MQIIVRDNNVDQALRALKKKLQREGVYREMKLRRHYEKPSEKRARERAAAVRRARKLERKRWSATESAKQDSLTGPRSGFGNLPR
jgi:small subunit ribosomal protein S21